LFSSSFCFHHLFVFIIFLLSSSFCFHHLFAFIIFLLFYYGQ